MKGNGVPQGEACQRLRISRASLCEMLAFKYPGDVGRICATMVRFMADQKLRALAPAPPPFATTTISEQVVEALVVARIERLLAVVVGPTGVGKTAAVRAYCEQAPDVICVEAGTHAKSWTILHEIAMALGLEWPGCAALRDMRVRISDALAERGGLVIVDEVDYVPEATLQDLRFVQEAADLGLVLVGTLAFLMGLRGRESDTVDQALGRIGYVARVGPCSADDIARIAAPLDLGDGALAELVAGSGGQARRAVHALRAAQRCGEERPTAAGIRRGFRTLLPLRAE